MNDAQLPTGTGTRADQIGGPASHALVGYDVRYTYSTGREYKLNFEADVVTFTMLGGPNYRPEFGTPVSLPYRTRDLANGSVLVHWLVPGRSGHVAIVVDAAAKRLHVGALMPGKGEFFDVADISEMALRPPGTVVSGNRPPQTHGGAQPDGPSAGMKLPPFMVQDCVGGVPTTRLAGRSLQARLSTGAAWKLDFGTDTVHWSENGAASLSMPYRACELRGGLILAHWMEEGRAGHVTLVIDLASQCLHISALLPGKVECFDSARIDSIEGAEPR